MFAVRTVKYLSYRFRGKAIEQIGKNRKFINERWDQLTNYSSLTNLVKSNDALKLIIS